MRAFTTGAPAATRRRSDTGLLYLVLSGLLWGTGGLTGSLLARTSGLSAISVAACRRIRRGRPDRRVPHRDRQALAAGRAAWTRITAIGLLAAIFQSCYFTAVALTSVPLATLVTIGAAPVIVLGADRVPGRRTGRFALATTALAVTGVPACSWACRPASRNTAVLASAGMAVLAAAGFAAVTLAGSRPVPGLDDLTVTGFGFTIGGLALMPVAQIAGGIGFRPGLAAIGLLVALGTGPTAVAYTLYFRGLRSAAASTGALLSLLEPLTGTVLAALLLGGAAERDRYRGRGHHRHRRDPHGAGQPRSQAGAGHRAGAGRARGPSIACVAWTATSVMSPMSPPSSTVVAISSRRPPSNMVLRRTVIRYACVPLIGGARMMRAAAVRSAHGRDSRPITGRPVMITGAASGIGRSLARRLSRSGSAVAIADVDGACLKDTAKSLPGPVLMRV